MKSIEDEILIARLRQEIDALKADIASYVKQASKEFKDSLVPVAWQGCGVLRFDQPKTNSHLYSPLYALPEEYK